MKVSSALVALSLAVGVTAIVPPEPLREDIEFDHGFCGKGKPGYQLCGLANEFPNCSKEYAATMRACLVTGCIMFVRDPLDDCDLPDERESAPNSEEKKSPPHFLPAMPSVAAPSVNPEEVSER